MKPFKAMLMAAGMGTRLRPFSEKISKPLMPILGVPCSRFALQSLSEAGVTEVIANLHHLPDMTREGLKKIFPALQTSDETAQLLGSAGGIKKAQPFLESPDGGGAFYVLNADTICSLDLLALAETHQRLRAKNGVLLTLAVLEQQAERGEEYREIFLDEKKEKIIGLGKKTCRGIMYSGCAILEVEALRGVPEGVPAGFVESILHQALEAGRVGAHLFSGDWMDIGTPQLWWKTQLNLLDRLERGSLPQSWARVLKRELKQLGPGLWTTRDSALSVAPKGWSAPCFWSGHGAPPAALGPQAILYGAPPLNQELSFGIGLAGDWVSLK